MEYIDDIYIILTPILLLLLLIIIIIVLIIIRRSARPFQRIILTILTAFYTLHLERCRGVRLSEPDLARRAGCDLQRLSVTMSPCVPRRLSVSTLHPLTHCTTPTTTPTTTTTTHLQQVCAL